MPDDVLTELITATVAARADGDGVLTIAAVRARLEAAKSMSRASKMSEPGARIPPCSPAKLQLRIGLQVLGSCKRSILEDRAGAT